MGIKVLVVDDSAVMRRLLSEILGSDPEIDVVGAAADPYLAREKIKALDPDVLTLDVEMPRMDGLTFLRNLMRLRPMPVVMVSSLTENGAGVTLQALELGAVDFVTKPSLGPNATGFDDYAEEVKAKVKVAARARVREVRAGRSGGRPEAPAAGGCYGGGERIIAIGASTGGTEAIKAVLMGLPPTSPPCVIAQHIPGSFSKPFAERMDRCARLRVFHAEDGQVIEPGHAYIAPGGYHLRVVRRGSHYVCELNSGDLVHRHRPSVDVLFESVARAAGRNAVGILLTGMGRDGACGLGDMRQAGAATIAQDEESSVVWGMPGEAIKLGAAAKVLPLDDIASAALGLVSDTHSEIASKGHGASL